MSGTGRPSDTDLIAYLDDELDPERREEIEAQLAQDSAGSAHLERWRRNDELLRAALGRVGAEPLPPGLLGHRPEGAPPADAPVRAPIRPVRRLERIRREQREKLVALTVGSFALGAIGALAAAGFTQMAPRLLAEPAAYVFPGVAARLAGERIARRAMEAFWTFSSDDVHPADATTEGEIASWLTPRVGAPVRAPNLAPFNLRLVGGRLTPDDHAAAAFILYRTPAGNQIGLFIGRTAGQDVPFQYSHEHVTGAVWWTERGASYAVVGRADRFGLMKVARAVQAQSPQRGWRRTVAASGR